ncbi:dihydrolipoyl dehydrogenase [Vallitalea longa]|uniref:Dihydrolipoyl dehydrogenase n=1 Tax=Vallitalea longa TaxID=2936439 RepID=A0A9W5Y9T6_9FIRM|nr:dihydrolipoyl dehydrogenase [Vallitalea longa]GKX29532.1 dihydrolipoyl dehydrogenase [Vallitalea longa]
MKDIIIIGGGPGGYVAAIRAAQLGAYVTLIEKDSFGGTCLNRGCIPTKTLYRSAEIINLLGRGQEFGIDIEGYNINYSNILKRKDEVVGKLVNGVEKLLQDNDVEIIKGTAIIKDTNKVEVTLDDDSKQVVEGKNIIIATGSIPAKLPIDGMDEDGVLTTREILECADRPNDLVIIGGGVVGMEFASIFNAFGCKVSVIEFLPNILNGVDSAISKRFKSMAKRKNIDIMTNAKVTGIKKCNSRLQVTYESKNKQKSIESDKVLVAVGRKPNLDNIGLENVSINYDKKGIIVDDNYETNVEGIYAIGDVNGKLMLAHEASHQGIKVVENIMQVNDDIDSLVVPSCIFVFPEIACVGMTEQQAKEENINIETGKFMFSANGKAMALGEEEGFVKIVADKDTDEIIGVHILGPHASDLIHEGTLAIQNRLHVKDIIKTIHAHPTLSEAVHEAALDVDARGIHIMPKRNIK